MTPKEEADKAWEDYFKQSVWRTGTSHKPRMNAINAYKSSLRAEVENRIKIVIYDDVGDQEETCEPETQIYCEALQYVLKLIDTVRPKQS